MYKFIQDGDKYIISIDNHQEIMSALAAFCQEQGILAGEVHGIGAVNKATLRFLNPVTKKYVDKTFEEQMEASSLVGNISEKDGKVYLHVHANFGRADYTVVGGHLLSATLNGACELVVTRFHCKIDRQFDDETGLNLYKFD
ncbi:MAG: PPC domain-containing DNA-binding protein [Candidatus Cryptobacteroides sp.]|jgi:predicted DNA-binding protein with PD1-like motif|nr:DNA-binding protein [Bacteroidales bacterium]MCI5720089.1 DNA-binding protein [Bacteroidales bacterium]MDY6320400.1 PPC domain-containing DNA-binding protein [Bacteroidales bacterium]MEE3390925.1 PPC domain-containing DNA-binding protein [Candidatus Cryptobacteroides sp.]MEE3430337.1 PPC domain-containing DNA-binding protein [Candidatus Cryptobacteroides sp.]